MNIEENFLSKRLVKSYPGLKGASFLSVVKMSAKPILTGKLFKQLKEQKTVDLLLKKSINTINMQADEYIVQIGANDGQHSDPLREVLATGKLKAVLVEPMPIAFKELEKLYKDHLNIKLINNAISDSGEKLTLYIPEIKGKELQSTLWANPSKEQALREVERIMGKKALKKIQIRKFTIKSLTAKKLCIKAGIKPDKISILVCDTEGQDAGIISSFLDYGCRPKVIFYEKLHVNEKLAYNLNTRLGLIGYKITQSNKDVYATLEN